MTDNENIIKMIQQYPDKIIKYRNKDGTITTITPQRMFNDGFISHDSNVKQKPSPKRTGYGTVVLNDENHENMKKINKQIQDNIAQNKNDNTDLYKLRELQEKADRNTLSYLLQHQNKK